MRLVRRHRPVGTMLWHLFRTFGLNSLDDNNITKIFISLNKVNEISLLYDCVDLLLSLVVTDEHKHNWTQTTPKEYLVKPGEVLD